MKKQKESSTCCRQDEIFSFTKGFRRFISSNPCEGKLMPQRKLIHLFVSLFLTEWRILACPRRKRRNSDPFWDRERTAKNILLNMRGKHEKQCCVLPATMGRMRNTSHGKNPNLWESMCDGTQVGQEENERIVNTLVHAWFCWYLLRSRAFQWTNSFFAKLTAKTKRQVVSVSSRTPGNWTLIWKQGMSPRQIFFLLQNREIKI